MCNAARFRVSQGVATITSQFWSAVISPRGTPHVMGCVPSPQPSIPLPWAITHGALSPLLCPDVPDVPWGQHHVHADFCRSPLAFRARQPPAPTSSSFLWLPNDDWSTVRREHVFKPIHPLIDIRVVSVVWLSGTMLWWTLLCRSLCGQVRSFSWMYAYERNCQVTR